MYLLWRQVSGKLCVETLLSGREYKKKKQPQFWYLHFFFCFTYEEQNANTKKGRIYKKQTRKPLNTSIYRTNQIKRETPKTKQKPSLLVMKCKHKIILCQFLVLKSVLSADVEKTSEDEIRLVSVDLWLMGDGWFC